MGPEQASQAQQVAFFGYEWNFEFSHLTVKSHVDSRRSGAMMVADEGRDSALIRAWFNLRHKLATASSRHQETTFKPLQDVDTQVYVPWHMLAPDSRKGMGSMGSPAL